MHVVVQFHRDVIMPDRLYGVILDFFFFFFNILKQVPIYCSFAGECCNTSGTLLQSSRDVVSCNPAFHQHRGEKTVTGISPLN